MLVLCDTFEQILERYVEPSAWNHTGARGHIVVLAPGVWGVTAPGKGDCPESPIQQFCKIHGQCREHLTALSTPENRTVAT